MKVQVGTFNKKCLYGAFSRHCKILRSLIDISNLHPPVLAALLDAARVLGPGLVPELDTGPPHHQVPHTAHIPA